MFRQASVAVIQIIAENLFKTTFDDKDLPCLQTAVNIADEGHVLAKIQATEQMLTAANYTLHADGTGRNMARRSSHTRYLWTVVQHSALDSQL